MSRKGLIFESWQKLYCAHINPLSRTRFFRYVEVNHDKDGKKHVLSLNLCPICNPHGFLQANALFRSDTQRILEHEGSKASHQIGSARVG